jgi:DNA-directed RNA polymerase specialized sigma24 family protein
MLSHLHAVYAFALSLVGDDADRASTLAETVCLASRDGRWSALGTRGLRERMLAQCVATFVEAYTPSSHQRDATMPAADSRSGVMSRLLSLPWQERAAITLVDHLGLTYAEAAAVLGIDAPEFRGLLHRGRDVLLRAHRVSAARRTTPTTTDRRRLPE